VNVLAELRLHAESLATAVQQNPKFFAAVSHYVVRLRDAVASPSVDLTADEIRLLAQRIEAFWEQWRDHDTPGVAYFPPRETADTDATVKEINRLVTVIVSMKPGDFRAMLPTSDTAVQTAMRARSPESRPCIFVGHGRSSIWAKVKAYLEDDLGLAVVTYESEPRTGDSIVPILERMLGQVTFAVLILTAEDETPEGKHRPRQNVVHEAGLFQGRLGFKRAVLLVQEGVEEFSNVAGLQHIPFTGDRVEQAFYELQRVLEREKQLPQIGSRTG